MHNEWGDHGETVIGATLLMDGAMGTEFLRHGIALSTCLDSINLSNPALVSDIHGRYRAAGAPILTTNTFGGNRVRLRHFGCSDRVREINIAGVNIARDAAGGGPVAGCIGPTGETSAGIDLASVQSVFREQAQWLDIAGVDIFSCETFSDVHELTAAIRGIRDVSERPIFAQMTFTSHRKTPRGLSPAAVADTLCDLPITGIGVNCAVGTDTATEVARALRRETSLPLIVQPNAGAPTETLDGFEYPLDPPTFAGNLLLLSEVASIVGGCCGTTPDHIRAARQYLPLAPLDSWPALLRGG
ncbi:MAG: hypothetical protein NVSMB52_14560 [Chloroflexota bacterium]